MVTRHFWKMLDDATVHDFAHILRYEKVCKYLFVLNSSTRSVHHPCIGDVPWNVVLTLGTHNLKHVFSTGQRPKFEAYNGKVLDLKYKLLWKLNGEPYVKEWWKYGTAQAVKEYRGVPDARHSAMIQKISETAWKAIKVACRSPSTFNNRPRYVKSAFRWLKDGVWKAVPTDKDGGCCLVEKTFIPVLVAEKLKDETKYEYVHYENLETIKSQLKKHCAEVAEAYGDKEMKRTLLNKVTYTDSKKLVQNVLFNIKSHKPDGEVSIRLIHSATGHPAASL